MLVSVLALVIILHGDINRLLALTLLAVLAAYVIGTIYAESFPAPVVAAPDMRALMQGDGIHPNAEGVALIVEALGPQVEALIALAAQP